MSKVSFSTFLKKYVLELSAENSMSFRKLGREVIEGNHRLKEPLILLSIVQNKWHLIKKYFPEDETIAAMSYDELVLSLKINDLPREYCKVWHSFECYKNSRDRDNRVKELMRKRILALQKEKGCSTYRLCKNLGLNNGNVYDWLKNGNNNRVSYSTAARILVFLKTTKYL